MSDVARPAIVLAAFGSSYDAARAVYRGIEVATRERFVGYEIRWAFTSSMVRRILKERGETIDSPAECFERLRKDGYRQVVVQSLHVVPGEEYHRLAATRVDGLDVRFGRPLLSTDADIDALIGALTVEMKPAMPNVFVGHGNDKHPEYNATNVAVDRRLRQRFENVILASVEGEPGPAPLEEIRPLAQAAGAVHFIPMMLVAGDHVQNDVMGDDPDSWKSLVAAAETTCSPPLGAHRHVIKLYLDHLAEQLEALQIAGAAS